MTRGTVQIADIYGTNGNETLPTQSQGNPNDSDATGVVSSGEASITNMKGNLLGQPILWWGGMIGLLVLAKFLVEKEG